MLREEWDPIHVKNGGPEDEYDSYVPKVFSLILHKASRDAIAAYLYQVETEQIGMSGNVDFCLTIADKLLAAFNKNRM